MLYGPIQWKEVHPVYFKAIWFLFKIDKFCNVFLDSHYGLIFFRNTYNPFDHKNYKFLKMILLGKTHVNTWN